MSYFGQIPAPMPPTPPPNTGPTISPSEELAILRQTLPVVIPQQSFLERNQKAIYIGGAVFILGIIGMILLVKI